MSTSIVTHLRIIQIIESMKRSSYITVTTDSNEYVLDNDARRVLLVVAYNTQKR